MSILIVNCKCGSRLRAREEYAGKRARCPACSEVLTVPEDDSPVPRPTRSVGIQKTRPARVRVAAEVEEAVEDVIAVQEPEPRRKETARPLRTRKRRSLRYPDEDYSRSSSLNWGTILGGVGMILLAVVWFVGGLLFLDRLFFYPPVLFIGGIIALGKGLTGRE